MEMRRVPIDPDDRTGRRRRDGVEDRRQHGSDRRIRVQLRLRHDRSDRRSSRRSPLERGVGLHVDGCLGGFLLPFGEMLGFDIPVFDFRLPGVTTISADTHKYGYSVKGTSILMFRNKELRNGQYFFMTDWSGGKYASPGIDGITFERPARGDVGVAGLARAARATSTTPRRSSTRRIAMQDVVRAQPELRIIGNPSFCFSFTSDEFDIYHLNDAMRARGWRLNGQQYPNAVHMAVTRPQTQPGVLEAWIDDIPAAVAYANEHRGEPAQSSAIYGGSATPTAEITAKINSGATALLDAYQSLPPESSTVPPERRSATSEAETHWRLGRRDGSGVRSSLADDRSVVGELHRARSHSSAARGRWSRDRGDQSEFRRYRRGSCRDRSAQADRRSRWPCFHGGRA